MALPLEYQFESDGVRLPVSAVIVAWVCIGFGAMAVIGLGYGVGGGEFHSNSGGPYFGVLGVLIGRGILRRKPVWHVFAWACTWLGLMGSVVMMLVCIMNPESSMIRMGGWPGNAGRGMALGVSVGLWVAVFGWCVWQHHVLTHPDVMAAIGGGQDRKGGEPYPLWLWLRWWMVGVLVIFIVGRVWGSHDRDQLRRANQRMALTFTMSQRIQDSRGHFGLVDTKRNAVGIVAVPPDGCEYSVEPGPDGYVVEIKAPRRKYSVPMEPGVLCVGLPDGRVGKFRVPEGFAQRVVTEGWNGGEDGSYLRVAVKLMGDAREKAKLEQFLAGYQEPESGSRRRERWRASSRPTTEESP